MADTPEIVISADGHMAEPPDLWEKELPARFRDRAPTFKDRLLETNHHLRAGGWDARERLRDMAADGVAAELLYPTNGVRCWVVGDDELEEACLRVYNDFMIDFCKVGPERLWGLGMLSLRNIDHAIAEMGRVKNAGLRGADIWIVPPEEQPYSDERYEPFWAAAQEMEMPLAMHINGRAQPGPWRAVRALHSANDHKYDSMNALGHLIASGVLERYPRLKFSVAECGVGWVPFWLQEMDYYSARGGRYSLSLKPSEYFERQVGATFITDQVGVDLLPEYGRNTFMWSSDYPHPACVWPDSLKVIREDLGHLDEELLANVTANTAARFYNGGRLPPPPDSAPNAQDDIAAWAEQHPEFGANSRPRTAALA
jgi:uncharacterized protein